MIFRIKTVLAIILLSSFFLPLVHSGYYLYPENERYNLVEGELIEKDGKPVKKIVNVIYPYQKYKNNIETFFIIVLPFIWPCVMLLVYKAVKNKRFIIVFKYAETLFYIGTMYVIYMLIVFGVMSFSGSALSGYDIGAYFSVVFILGYGFMLTYEIFRDLQRAYKRTRAL